MVRFCSLFDPKERTVTFLNGQTYSLASLRALGMGSLLDAMFDFSEKLGSLGLEPDEMALFMAVVLVSAGKKYKHPLRTHAHHALSYSCLTPDSPPSLFLRPLWNSGGGSSGAAAGESDKSFALPYHAASS